MQQIKLQKRYKYAGDIYPKLIEIGFDLETAQDFINSIKDADVVEVVRCKDCKHKNPRGYKCLRDNLWHDSDDFCSYGERKE